MRRKKFMHFSHHHPLHETNVKEDDGVVCSCCWLGVTGPGFKCINSHCDFIMHKSCIDLPQRIHHKSHPAHALTLDPNRAFCCDACGEKGSGFPYYCSVCDYDIHVKCSSLPETVKREEHEHPISLYYSMINENDNTIFVCDICDGRIKHGCWVYYCQDCDFGTHLECKEAEEEGEEGVEKAANSEPCKAVTSLTSALEQMQLIQLRLQASRQQAQIIQEMGRNAIRLTGDSIYRTYY